MNILLKLFPTILTHRKELKFLKTKDASVGSLWSTPVPILGYELFIFFLLNSKRPPRTCHQGSSGQQQFVLS